MLDRANVLEFSDVDLEQALGGGDPPTGSSFRLREPRVAPGWLLADPDAQREAERRAKRHPVFAARLRELHALLAAHHLHFGYRVIDEMARFVRLRAGGGRGRGGRGPRHEDGALARALAQRREEGGEPPVGSGHGDRP